MGKEDFNFEDLGSTEGSAMIELPDDIVPNEDGTLDLGGTGGGLEEELNDFNNPPEDNTGGTSAQGGTSDNTDKDKGTGRPDPIVIELEDVTDTDDTGKGEDNTNKETSLNDTPPGENKEASQENPNPYLPFAQVIAKEGYFTEEQLKEITDSGEKAKEVLFEKVRENYEEGLQEYIDEQVPEELKTLFDNYRKGVPLAELSQIYDARGAYQKLSDEQLKENEKYQEQVMTDYFKLKGLDATEASDYIESLKTTGKLEAKSVEAKGAIVNYYDSLEAKKVQDQEQARIAQEARNAQTLKDIQASIKATEEIIPGIKLDSNMKKTVFSNMTKASATDKDGNPISAIQAIRAKNPIEFEKRLNYFAAMGFFDEKPDFSVMKNKIKSDVVDGLDDTITKFNQANTKSGVAAPASRQKSAEVDYDEMLNGF